MESVRINYNKCGEQSFAAFIKNINNNSSFVFKAHNPADESVMQDRYTFTKNNFRVSIVYETKAQTLIITAPHGVMSDVEALVPVEVTAQNTHIQGVYKDEHNEEDRKVFVRENKAKRPSDLSGNAQPIGGQPTLDEKEKNVVPQRSYKDRNRKGNNDANGKPKGNDKVNQTKGRQGTVENKDNNVRSIENAAEKQQTKSNVEVNTKDNTPKNNAGNGIKQRNEKPLNQDSVKYGVQKTSAEPEQLNKRPNDVQKGKPDNKAQPGHDGLKSK